MIKIDNIVDKTYILHLDFREDRYAHVKNELFKIDLNNYNFFKAYSPLLKNIPHEYIKHLRSRYIQYIHGYNCILFGHLDIIKDAKKNNYEKILILEDDVQFNNNFNYIMNNVFSNQINNMDWDALWLGINLTNISEEDRNNNKITENLVKINFDKAYGAFCYILKNTTYDFIINNMLNNLTNMLYSMDVFCLTHLKNNFNCYYITPNIANTIMGFSDSSGYPFTQEDFNKAFNY